MEDLNIDEISLILDTSAKDLKQEVDNYISSFQRETDLYNARITDLNSEIELIKAEISKLEEKRANNESLVNNEKIEKDEIEKEIVSLKLKESECRLHKDEIEAAYMDKKRKYSLHIDDIADSEKEEEKKELTIGLLYYSKRLQMYFNKDIGGTRITFKAIDSKHPQRRFYVVVTVDEQYNWQCVRTKPVLQRVDSLVANLKRTNNITQFLVQVRRQFHQEYCMN